MPPERVRVARTVCRLEPVMNLASKPLAGLKVIELGTLIAGPFAARICAEFGAEVIKVESPDGGDPLPGLQNSREWQQREIAGERHHHPCRCTACCLGRRRQPRHCGLNTAEQS